MEVEKKNNKHEQIVNGELNISTKIIKERQKEEEHVGHRSNGRQKIASPSPDSNLEVRIAHKSPDKIMALENQTDIESNQINLDQIFNQNPNSYLLGCSEKLKSLLTTNTPIKEKLDIANLETELAIKVKSWNSQIETEKTCLNPSPRRTRSQARIKTISQNSTKAKEKGDYNSTQSVSSSAGIDTRLEEIGSICGFKNETFKSQRGKQKKNDRNGATTKSQ
ncbi:hypothetical protein L2E82_16172 [Cichorium intybus]|uniref:Uncharacterized protein n=1 Tax=Cichorium intybus TaxID=13427 RepID=A0ACB9F638_CICIN|nr:hypothetical protein L2E82_16172 [Cichorium intybus]